jgi:hypothetical protein
MPMGNNNTSEDNMDTTKIAEFMGAVSAELKNGNKLMEQLQQGQEALKDQVSDVKSNIQVMKTSSELKRDGCDKIFEKHETKMIELDDRSRRDKILLNELEKRLANGDLKDKTKKEVIVEQKEERKEKREITAFQMGVVLFAIQLVSFALVFLLKK